jgi:uncharacterized repeat protein (TIGR02543 family)
VPGGLDYEFESVETEGTCFSDFSRADQDEVAVRISEGEFPAFTFQTPSQPTHLWKVDFSGSFSGSVNVTFGYDPTLLPPGFAESGLALYHATGGAWEKLPAAVNATTHAITASTTSLGVFALGADAITNYVIGATSAPANSGTITGGGSYVEGSSVTLSAVANPGYFFTHWTEDAAIVSTSPAFTFIAQGNRTLVANFTIVGTGRVVATSATPAAGGTTGGGGEYALGSEATVSATAYPGYKFSKWLLNGASVSISQNYTFTVSGDITLVAKFKPVYYLTITAEPPDGGEPEGDPFYEMGELVKLKAKPLPGWSLVNWTQNGLIVSTDENFSFNMNGNRDLVANYALGSRVDLLADPKTAGKVTGAGVFEATAPVTVTAEPLPGYIFLDWTENGGPVSNTAEYTLTTAQPRLLTARFVALPAITVAPAAGAGQLVFTWPDAPGWSLEESINLSGWAASTRDITTLGGQRSITVSTSEGRVFFRLKYQ